MPEPLLEVQGLETTFKTPDGVVHAVNGVSFNLKEGETLGVVGESGCGKSVTMLSILGLIPSPPGKVHAGSAKFFDQDLMKMSRDEIPVSYTHLRAHETPEHLVCRLLL